MIVEVFNINKGHNKELVETCRDLQDYVEYTHRVRTYAEKIPIEEAVEKAINECIQEDILKDFLEANRAEAIKVSIYEYHERKRAWEGTAFTQRAANEDRELCSRYNEQEHIRMEREDAFEDGRKAGHKLGLDEGHKLGLETGRNQLFELMNKMTADGLGDQTHRLASEPDFYQEMVKKYLET